MFRLEIVICTPLATKQKPIPTTDILFLIAPHLLHEKPHCSNKLKIEYSGFHF